MAMGGLGLGGGGGWYLSGNEMGPHAGAVWTEGEVSPAFAFVGRLTFFELITEASKLWLL